MIVIGDDDDADDDDDAAAAAFNDDSNAATAAFCTSQNSLFISIPIARPAPPIITAANKTPVSTISIQEVELQLQTPSHC